VIRLSQKHRIVSPRRVRGTTYRSTSTILDPVSVSHALTAHRMPFFVFFVFLVVNSWHPSCANLDQKSLHTGNHKESERAHKCLYRLNNDSTRHTSPQRNANPVNLHEKRATERPRSGHDYRVARMNPHLRQVPIQAGSPYKIHYTRICSHTQLIECHLSRTSPLLRFICNKNIRHATICVKRRCTYRSKSKAACATIDSSRIIIRINSRLAG
jgi:hypothetical protein